MHLSLLTKPRHTKLRTFGIKIVAKPCFSRDTTTYKSRSVAVAEICLLRTSSSTDQTPSFCDLRPDHPPVSPVECGSRANVYSGLKANTPTVIYNHRISIPHGLHGSVASSRIIMTNEEPGLTRLAR